MAKRRFRSKKGRFVAIGAALATAGAAITLLPSANAADETKTPEEIMIMCERSHFVNGERRSLADIGEPSIGGNFLADRCDFVETKFETFNGPTQKVTQTFPNCEPNAAGPASVDASWETTVGQGEGKYTATQRGGGGGLLGFLLGSWQKHEGTLDLTVESATATSTEGPLEVPVGKELHVEFTPKMQRMFGVWRVVQEAEPVSIGNPGSPERVFEAEEVIEGPHVLPGAAGAPGVADGTAKVVLNDCPK